ncbi:replication initiator protein A [Enterococcus dongliensis]|uniref:replication initiator protein A n=1 Tax=Enterococcus dongliensis TaxID=2559925 RepID=UPI0028903919|nr:replication initiator protein A [Enterococcus dongliensis]MDT2640827.1 replication initiator protein A [Enterococcus dongliensis]
MTDFKYISANETYKALFYQLPKILFESKKYFKMTNDSKIAYAMLKDRCEYSLQNNWVDKDGNIYFIFTTEELMQLLHCGNKKVAAIKKELASFGLLLSKRMPPKILPDGSKKGVPARLYLGQLDLTAKDVFTDKSSKSDLTISESVKMTSSKKEQYNSLETQSVKMTSSKKNVLNQGLSESVQMTRNLYNTKELDTNRHLIDTQKDLLQEQILLENFINIMQNDSIATFIPERVLTLIKAFSNTYAEAQQTVKTIHNAKNKAQEQTGIHVVFEELEIYGINAEVKLYDTLLKAYQKQKTEKVENIQNLIFVYVKNWFIESPCAAINQALTNEELPHINLPKIN